MRLLLTLGACFLAHCINAAPLHNIVVFGDSLSDNGNLYELMQHQFPQSPPYYEGRFSNGPVWVEQIAAFYFPNTATERLFDYAVGGSGVLEEEDDDDVLLTFNKQISTYLIAHQDKANPDDLYVIWIGANNYLGDVEDPEQAVGAVNSGIVKGLRLLAEKGAKHVLVFNLPNLGKTPMAIEFDAVSSMGYVSELHNERLRQSVVSLKETNPETEWLYLDAGSIFAEVINHPANYGFVDVTHACSNTVANASMRHSLLKMTAKVTPKAQTNACDGYLFFDLVHPTVLAHQLIAQKVRELFDEEGVVFAE